MTRNRIFTGDTAVDIYSPGPTIAKIVYRSHDVNLATGSLELSAECVM